MTHKTVVYTYGTGNPVEPNGSGDVRDGIDNLQSFDVFMNAEEDTYNQRDGDVVKTIAGAVKSVGIERVGDFTSGCTVTARNQGVLEVGGSVYVWLGVIPVGGKIVPPGSTPGSTGGISPAGDWLDVGDASAYQKITDDMAALSGGFAGFVFSDVPAMKAATPVGFDALPDAVLSADQMARTMSYHGGWAAVKEPVGAATYLLTTLVKVRAVRGGSWVPDGYVDHYLAVSGGATYVAVILTGDTIAIEQAGAIQDNPAIDNYNQIQAALTWATTSYGRARQVTAGAGDFYYSKALLIEPSSVNLGMCTGIIGAGWNRTYFVKTTNTPISGSEDYSVDAYIAFKTRSTIETLYDYGSRLQHFTCKSTAPAKHQYGIYGRFLSHMDWAEIEVQSALIGVLSHDAWMIRFSGVRANLCGLGFKITGNGTTLNFSNVWAHDCTDGGYDITGVVYSGWENCGADSIFDPLNPTVNKVAYKFTNCQAVTLSGCGMEGTSEAFYLDNSTVNVTGFRVNSVINGDSGQTLIRAVNGAGGSFDTCGFTSVPATSDITVQSKDSTSYLRFENCAFQVANSGVPNDGATRRNGLTTNMPLDAQGLKTVKVAMNGATNRVLTPLKANCGFMILSGVSESADTYITLTKPFWAYSEISTSTGSPTTIGSLVNAAGAVQTSLRAVRVVDAFGVEVLQVSFSGGVVVTLLFTLQTAQHW